MKDFIKCNEACITCLIICENCTLNCSVIGDKNCLKFYRDCANICISCVKFEIQNSDLNQGKPEFCAKVCKECVAECKKHLSHYSSCDECEASCNKQCKNLKH